jgi:hypothetical protein
MALIARRKDWGEYGLGANTARACARSLLASARLLNF